MGVPFIHSFISDNRYCNSSLHNLCIKMGKKNTDAASDAYNDITTFPVFTFIYTVIWKEGDNNCRSASS